MASNIRLCFFGVSACFRSQRGSWLLPIYGRSLMAMSIKDPCLTLGASTCCRHRFQFSYRGGKEVQIATDSTLISAPEGELLHSFGCAVNRQKISQRSSSDVQRHAFLGKRIAGQILPIRLSCKAKPVEALKAFTGPVGGGHRWPAPTADMYFETVRRIQSWEVSAKTIVPPQPTSSLRQNAERPP